MTEHQIINCDPTRCICKTDPVDEARKVESTKWAKLLAHLGYPMDFGSQATEYLDDDMIVELAVAWRDLDLAGGSEDTKPDSDFNDVEPYEDMIRDELSLA